MDDLFGMEVDQAEVEETLRKGLLPSGTYVTHPEEFGPMNVFIQRNEEKDDAGTVVGHRTMIAFTGRGRANVRLRDPKSGVVEAKTVEGRLRLVISPDYRGKRDRQTGEIDMDKPDGASALYAQAVKAFKATFQEPAKNVAQVVEFLRDHPARFRMIQVGVPTKNRPEPDGEPGNWIASISPLRGDRRIS